MSRLGRRPVFLRRGGGIGFFVSDM
jgi:hypothetical protein